MAELKEEYKDMDLSSSIKMRLNPTNVFKDISFIKSNPNFNDYLNGNREVNLAIKGSPTLRGSLSIGEKDEIQFTTEASTLDEIADDALIYAVFHDLSSHVNYCCPCSIAGQKEKTLILKREDPREFKRFKTRREVDIYAISNDIVKSIKSGSLRLRRRYHVLPTTQTTKELLCQEYFSEGGQDSYDPMIQLTGNSEKLRGTLLNMSRGGYLLSVVDTGKVKFKEGSMIYTPLYIPISINLRIINVFAFVREVSTEFGKTNLHCAFIEKQHSCLLT